MNRLQKKCLVVSAGIHLLLALLLVVGPAFVAPEPQPPDLPLLEFIPLKTTDDPFSGGGNPNANPPAFSPQVPPAQPPPDPKPQPPPPKAEPEKPKPREPDPVKEPAPREPAPREQETESDPDSVEPADKKQKKQFVFREVVNKPDPKAAKKKGPSEAEKRARQIAEARRLAATQVGQAFSSFGNALTPGVNIGEFRGPGGGGVPYANFYQALKTLYANAWILPEGVTDDDATATARVTIARDGTVLSARITRPSGNREVDRSVQEALDRVRHAVPLPDEARENQRTVPINFNVKAKRLLG
jgi:TonB family protein